MTLHHTIWTPKRLLSHAALSPSKIKFTVSYRSFLSKPNPPALSGSCKFIEGFSRYFLAPFMASFVNKEAFLPAGLQVRFMKHPLSSSHCSQVLFIPLNKPKTSLKRCWWLMWVQGSYKKLQLFFRYFSRNFQGPPIRNVISQIGLHKNAHSRAIWTGRKAWTVCSTNVFTFFSLIVNYCIKQKTLMKITFNLILWALIYILPWTTNAKKKTLTRPLHSE